MPKLTTRKCETAKAGKHSDEGCPGLILVVSPKLRRKFILRIQVDGRRRDLPLGPFPHIPLADARVKATDDPGRCCDGR